MFPRYHPHCFFLSGFPAENAHSFILNAYHGSAYLISDDLSNRVQQTGSGMFPIVWFLHADALSR